MLDNEKIEEIRAAIALLSSEEEPDPDETAAQWLERQKRAMKLAVKDNQKKKAGNRNNARQQQTDSAPTFGTLMHHLLFGQQDNPSVFR